MDPLIERKPNIAKQSKGQKARMHGPDNAARGSGTPLFLQRKPLSPALHGTIQRQEYREEEEELLQPKLKVSQPDDVYEKEADEVADRVMQMPETALR
jgi:hypothetical protein